MKILNNYKVKVSEIETKWFDTYDEAQEFIENTKLYPSLEIKRMRFY